MSSPGSVAVAAAVAGWFASPKEVYGPVCLCGTPLVSGSVVGAVTRWLCTHCGRAFCRECGGMLARRGGCDVCTICGAGECG
ncbi:MAG: hypothetical protein AB1792_11085 [Candidatus Zixiibacteriota bacterium]